MPTPTPTAPPSPTAKLDPKFRTCGDTNDADYDPYYQGKDPNPTRRYGVGPRGSLASVRRGDWNDFGISGIFG